MEPEIFSPHSQAPATCLNLSQPNPVFRLTSHFLKINPNIIFPFTPGSPQRSLSLRFHNQYPVHTSPFLIRATCHVHLIILDFINRTPLGNEYIPCSSGLCNFLHFPVTSSLLGTNILLTIRFSNTLNLRSSLNVSAHVSHPYRTTVRIIILYILIFKFLDSILIALPLFY
jgi:hypothetical protein